MLTAIVVSQVSVGGSLRATIDYNIGTLGGALYAVAIGLAIPHATSASQALVLALAVGPMAVAAAMSPSFRVAPFSAVLVLLIGAELGESPILSALTRVLEVAIGGAVAVVVSLLVFPERAQALGLDAASKILERMAELLPRLLAGASRPADPTNLAATETALAAAMASFEGLVDETRRERIVTFAHAPDPAPLARTLLRIQHDFDLLGRATDGSFPETIARRLERAADPVRRRCGGVPHRLGRGAHAPGARAAVRSGGGRARRLRGRDRVDPARRPVARHADRGSRAPVCAQLRARAAQPGLRRSRPARRRARQDAPAAR